MNVKNAFSIGIGLLVLLFASSSALALDRLAGTWDVVITPPADASGADAKEIKDKLTFQGSKLTSEQFKKKGFDPVTYEEDTRGGVMATYKAEMKSKENGKLEWNGTSTGVDMTGEVKWIKPDGTELTYTIK